MYANNTSIRRDATVIPSHNTRWDTLKTDLDTAACTHRALKFPKLATITPLIANNNNLTQLQMDLVEYAVACPNLTPLLLKEQNVRTAAFVLLSEYLRPENRSLVEQNQNQVLAAMGAIVDSELRDPKPNIYEFANILSGLGEPGLPLVHQLADFAKQQTEGGRRGYPERWFTILTLASTMGESAAEWVVSDLQSWHRTARVMPYYDPTIKPIITTLSERWPKKILSLVLSLQTADHPEVEKLRYLLVASQIDKVAEIALRATTTCNEMSLPEISRVFKIFELITDHTTRFHQPPPTIQTLQDYTQGLANLLKLAAAHHTRSIGTEDNASESTVAPRKNKTVLAKMKDLVSWFFTDHSNDRETPATGHTRSISARPADLLVEQIIHRLVSNIERLACCDEISDPGESDLSCRAPWAITKIDARSLLDTIAPRFIDTVYPILKELGKTHPSFGEARLCDGIALALLNSSAICDKELTTIKQQLRDPDTWSRRIALTALTNLPKLAKETLRSSPESLKDLAQHLRNLLNDSDPKIADLAVDRFLYVTRMISEEDMKIECGLLLIDTSSRKRSLAFWQSLLRYSSEVLKLDEPLANIGFEVCRDIGDEYLHSTMERWVTRAFVQPPEKFLWRSTETILRECLDRSEDPHYRRHYDCKRSILNLLEKFCPSKGDLDAASDGGSDDTPYLD